MRLWSSMLAAVLGVLAVGVLAIPAAAKDGSFVDDDNSRYEPYIETARQEGLIRGCNPPDNDRVCPNHPVTRGTMAIMVARAIGASPSDANHSTDDDGLGAEGALDALIDRGARIRCGEGVVCPQRPITRAEMAGMIVDAFGWKADTNPALYADIGETRFGKELAELASRGVLPGCNPPINRRMCPDRHVPREEAVFALVTAMGLNPAETSEPRRDGGSLGFGDDFNELSLWDGRAPGTRNRVTLTNGGYEGTALRVRIPKGSHFGTDFHLHLEEAAEKPPEQLFFRYYLKLDSDWRTTSSGKLPGFSGVYGSTGKGGFQSRPTDPGWSARLMFSPNHGSDDRVRLGYYVYHLGQETRYGDGLGWNEAGSLQPGEWYCLEGQIGLNTPGRADGVLRAWVDGTPAFDRAGLQFRRPSEPEIKIESFWFNVYYGGKAVAPQNLGMTIDEVIVDTERVGCGETRKTILMTQGDFDGNGYQDRVSWNACPGGSCFWLERSTWTGTRVTRLSGDGAWFTMDSHRLGMTTGDLDGDGRHEIIYYGRCDASTRCWRVHDAIGGARPPANWGDGARFSGSADSLVLGDWNGDGLDDLAYRGRCGDEGRECWRVHQSAGDRFEPPRGWGRPPDVTAGARSADVTGDGRDDLIYRGPCDESECWFVQVSGERSFGDPIALGLVLEDGGTTQWIDFDGDGIADIISWVNSNDESWIEVRFLRELRLGKPVSLASLDRPIDDVALRRLDERSTVQAVVQLACEKAKPCVEQLMSPAPNRLVASTRFLEERRDRPGAPRID